jgi:diacylglycerol kinase family enzyme
MSLLKPKLKRNTWSQLKRQRVFLNGTNGNEKGDKNPGVKSQAHLARIVRRVLRRVARKQQEQAEEYARKQARPAQETNPSPV